MLPRLQDSMFIIHQYIMIAMQSSRHGTAGLLEFLNDARLFDTALTSLTQRERQTDRQTDRHTDRLPGETGQILCRNKQQQLICLYRNISSTHTNNMLTGCVCVCVC